MEINKIYNENCLEGLKNMPDEYVDCCITSPPYYGLRDYGTAQWEGGNPECKHEAAKEKTRYDYSLATSTIQDGSRTGTDGGKWKKTCPDCGAQNIDNQIGLEETPEQYVNKMVEVFTEVKRVLKKEGTLWLNLGDSYASNGDRAGLKLGGHDKNCTCSYCSLPKTGLKTKVPLGLKPKDLIGVPWMVAFALRSSGWYLRQDIIWHKPNPMPESVTDRCTKAHEYIFLLSKSSKYFYNADAIKYPLLEGSIKRNQTGWNGNEDRSYVSGPQNHLSKYLGSDKAKQQELANKRSVWTVTTKPYSESHFATFPQDLIVDMIKAGCPEFGTVLDPFMGAGTTALVASKLNRNFIGFELNPEYVKLANKRLQKELGMFNKAV